MRPETIKKVKKVKKAKALIAKGVPSYKACKTAGVSQATMTNYKQKYEKEASPVDIKIHDGAKRLYTPRKKQPDLTSRKLALLETMAETLRGL